MQRAQKFRLTALAGAAALAAAVPLAAATAGPADTAAPDARRTSAAAPHGSTGQRPGQDADAGAAPGADRRGDAADAARAEYGSTPTGRPRTAAAPDRHPPLRADGRRTVRCGPELASPQRIEAQTCVLAEGGRTWAGTYYRNPTGDPLRAVLTLLRPDRSSVQVHCELAAADGPGVCETSAAATVGPAGARQDRWPYDAVAEFSDAAGERLLLRAGSNSA
ncbi:hypothetical protein [Streptomyces celluloflavus]|uniref:hypothetical protein n=1 Tax=Streptomyces celluloflavus TaxID=58344 RepID=UPI0036620D0E